jgi:hypothetical protein
LIQANKFGLDPTATLKQLDCDNAKGATRVDEDRSAVIDDNTLISGCGDDQQILAATGGHTNRALV